MSAIFAAGGNPLNFLEQFGVEWQLLISQAISFVVVTTALYWFVFRPVIAASDKRKQQIEQGLRDAEQAKERLASAQAEADKKTAEAIAEASKILKSARDDAKETVENATREASAKVAEIRARNEEQLERDKLKLKEELKAELSGLVAQATEAVVGKVLTDQQRSELATIASEELKK